MSNPQTDEDTGYPYAAATLEPGATVPIFGRQPALWIALIEGGLLLGVQFLGLDGALQAAIMGLVIAGFAVFQAYMTSEMMLAAITGFVNAAILLAVFAGVDLTDAQTASIVGLVPLLVGMWQQPKTTPQQGFGLAA